MANDLDRSYMSFFDASEDLMTLIGHENAILMAMGGLNFEGYILHKIKLMQRFEKQAQFLLDKNHDCLNTDQKKMMAEEIRKVRDALKVNSAYHLQLLQAGSEREELPRAARAAMPEGAKCH